MAERIAPITMPKFGLAMTEGTVVGWLAKTDDNITAGQELVEIETTKITNVYESPVSGMLRRQIAQEGEIKPVGALIGVVANATVPEAEIDAFIAGFEAETTSKSDDGDTTATPANTIIEVGTLRLRVQDSGNAHSGKIPVVLIHGFAGSLENWMLTQPVLAEQTRVIAFDLPGHGESSKSVGDGTTRTMARTVQDLMNTLSIDRAHIVGHSLGGAIALELAALGPDLVASLTLIAPAGLGPAVNGVFIEGILTADRRKTLEPVLSLLVHDKTLISRQMIEDMIRFKRLDGVIPGLRTLAAASFEGDRQSISLLAALENYVGPVSILWGENDEILPVGNADIIPDQGMVTRYAGTGHMPQLERAREVAERLTAIITGQDNP